MTKRLIAAIVSVVLVLSLAILGCANKASLERGEWHLESYGTIGRTQTIIPGSEISLEFDQDEDRIMGSAGCNSYSAGYEIMDRFISIGRLSSTSMFCQEGIMEQELEYLEILQKSESYYVMGRKLTILSSGSRVLEFNRR